MKKILYALVIVVATQSVIASALDLDKHPALKSIAQSLVTSKHYNHAELTALFAEVELNPSVVAAFKRPAETLSWAKYRDLFITSRVVRNGVTFWAENADTLKRATREYGVPEAIIVAILGVETRFGQNKGSHAVINSLSTLSVQYERRKDFFQSELKSFLELAKSEQLNPLTTVGSYAGAMGIPQFIASSYAAYAIDFDGDGKRDLINSYPDAIGSVANYLSRHGWQGDNPVNVLVSGITDEQYNRFRQDGRSASHSVAAMRQSGVGIPPLYQDQLAADLIALESHNGLQHQLVFDNFYVIKRYNQSNLYAMAVSELAQAIQRKYRS